MSRARFARVDRDSAAPRLDEQLRQQLRAAIDRARRQQLRLAHGPHWYDAVERRR